MPEISIEALIVSIQAVAAELRVLSDAAQNGELKTEEYLLLEEYQRAAENLETAYIKLTHHILNLPIYNELVGED